MLSINEFVCKSEKKEILQYYFSLKPEEKTILNKYGAHLTMGFAYREVFSPGNLCEYLWVSAANIIPHGHYSLAKKLLNYALSITDSCLNQGHIHSNLAQVFAEEENWIECCYHCDKTISTGYFVDWAEKTKLKMANNIKANQIT